ncbi:MAG: adenosylmethionine--8-amino-7-oxononanoate transaminase [Verrucomicrobiales bacterium]|jgi:adenosylmethionine-8-amino-7-oxononanoate aminotransferase|nr:adenosylmethionine--8-amino-7-oxononanoate transaminase [Verrucomicrobiales bacterium]
MPAALDRKYLWHPFTPTDAWLAADYEPTVIVSGDGSWLVDERGRRYLDGNSSIWTNVVGHRNASVSAAIKAQLDRIAHSSFLGLTNELAPVLGKRLVELADSDGLTRCFFSDDGATAMEAALKITHQFFAQNGQPRRTKFVSLSAGYHGDTVGAMSVGHSRLFHHCYRQMLFESDEVMSPYCYRCPFNKAKPRRADARSYARCGRECVAAVEQKFAADGERVAAWVIEPRVQGAAGFIMHPDGWLAETCAVAQRHGALVILDEVMTGFGRAGAMFAWQKEAVSPDLVALAKGLTGGYLPLAATLSTEKIFNGFRGDTGRTFFHGHSYTGNQLGCAAALATLDILQSAGCADRQRRLAAAFAAAHERFWSLSAVGDVRQEGGVLAVELVKNAADREPFDPSLRVGARVCAAAKEHGLLTRPAGDVLLLMPPYTTTEEEVELMVGALCRAIGEVV